jgi:hypothetical protein
MITSRDRILVTHVGSLPRNDELSDLLIQNEERGDVDKDRLAKAMDRAVRQVVEKQAAAGVDIGNDGEQQRVGFQTYVAQRMSGFAGESKRRRGRDYEEFPELVEVLANRFPKRSRMQNAPEARSDLRYLGTTAINEELARLKKAASEIGSFKECFVTAPSPGIVSTTLLNGYYESQEAYLMALAREMNKEYSAIHQAGFLVQIDSPDLAMDRAMFYRDLSDRESTWRQSTRLSKVFPVMAFDCTAVGAIGMVPIFLTSLSISFCRFCIRRTSERSVSSLRIHAISTNIRPCDGTPCRPTWFFSPAALKPRATSWSIRKSWRGGYRKRFQRLAIVSESSPARIADLEPSLGVSG